MSCLHSELTRWLASQAEALGVEIYPGFAASEVLYSRAGTVQVAHLTLDYMV